MLRLQPERARGIRRVAPAAPPPAQATQGARTPTRARRPLDPQALQALLTPQKTRDHPRPDSGVDYGYTSLLFMYFNLNVQQPVMFHFVSYLLHFNINCHAYGPIYDRQTKGKR